MFAGSRPLSGALSRYGEAVTAVLWRYFLRRLELTWAKLMSKVDDGSCRDVGSSVNKIEGSIDHPAYDYTNGITRERHFDV